MAMHGTPPKFLPFGPSLGYAQAIFAHGPTLDKSPTHREALHSFLEVLYEGWCVKESMGQRLRQRDRGACSIANPNHSPPYPPRRELAFEDPKTAAKLILDERRIAGVPPGSGPAADTAEYHERVLRNLEAYVAPDGVGSAKRLGAWLAAGSACLSCGLRTPKPQPGGLIE